MIFPEPDSPPEDASINRIDNNTFIIILDWSKEAIEQAAYELTFNYMAEVGRIVYKSKPIPKGWEGMSSEEAGYNSIKEKLYYIMQPYHYKDENGEVILTRKQGGEKTRMVKLYNIYCFGYPRGIDSKEMLWPEDVRNR